MNYSYLTLLALAIVLLRVVQNLYRARQQRLPFPPGPPRLPLVGNFRDLSTKFPWLTYTAWGRQYGVHTLWLPIKTLFSIIPGDLVYANAFGEHIVIINSVKTATDLFEKRSEMYSERPVFTVAQLLGFDFFIGLMGTGDKWKRHRRLFEQQFRRDISRHHRPIQRNEIHQLLRGLLSCPQDFQAHIKRGVIVLLTDSRS
ncbi:cytochrome P450 [Mycena sanguinolenta]|nr:cytochrome P450 [Mycena sanguinolenta]